MNQVVIFFVPTGAKQRDFETALREHFESFQMDGVPSPVKKADCAAVTDNDQMPLWTWFIPNPCR